MSYNPYKERSRALYFKVNELQAEETALLTQMKNFENFDLENIRESIDKLQKTLLELKLDHDAELNRLEVSKASHAEYEEKLKSASGIFKMFSSEKAVFKRFLEMSSIQITKLSISLRKIQKEFEEVTQEIESLESLVDRHLSTDILELQSRLRITQASLVANKNEYQKVQEKSNEIELLVKDKVNELNEQIAIQSRVRRELQQAELFDQKLSVATNGKERAMIHQECERTFGVGSPREIINKCRGKLKTVESTIEKLQDFIKRKVELNQKDIKSIILDGNNLCYSKDNRYLGLSGLDVLVPMLAEKYKVSLVFDNGILGMEKTSLNSLKSRYPTAELHVMNHRLEADEAVLKAAQFDSSSFVISNDKYRDYKHMDAVKENRIFDFTVLNNVMMVEALDLSAPIKP